MPVANPLFSNSFDTAREHPARALRKGDSEILIFAKAPRAGQCKTRLARGLGRIRATNLYRSLLTHAVHQAMAAQPDCITLVCAPDTRHPLFQRLARRHGLRLIRQARGSLGRRMHLAFAAASRRSHTVILMGSDQPDAAALLSADGLPSLRADRAWLAPTFDGGYWAIGLRRPDSRVFHGPAWSTARVSAHTRTIMARVGQPAACALSKNDIDNPRDWHRLSRPLRTRLARNAAMPGLICQRSTGRG